MLCDRLPEWNRTEVEFPRDSTIVDAFGRQSALTPDAVAVIYKNRSLTYRELNELSSSLARHLQWLGVKPETLVGVCLGRSENLIVSLLGVLKAGGAYVPLDPSHPSGRLKFVVEDAGISILLVSTETRAVLPIESGNTLVVNVDDPLTLHDSFQGVEESARGCNLAYVMYTSGSTGTPKGVMVEHRNVVNFFIGMDRVIGSGHGVWLAVTSFAFDISALELLWTITRGFTVVVHGDGSAGSIAAEIVRHKVTHVQMTPSLARMMLLDAHALSSLSGLEKILLGGETVPATLVRQIRQSFAGDLYNMYGPTETTIWSTTYKIDEFGVAVPIGRPIVNTQVYLVNDKMLPVVQGDRGELFIGGAGVARGYIQRPELTAERFITLPALTSERIYRTGDLARIASDGNLEFLGRVDSQVKLRGNRIELGEIESALEQCPHVSQAAVMVLEDKAGDKRLVAYIVADHEGPAMMGRLRGMLATKLPEVMVPSRFLLVPRMPLTENGKIDRKALLNLSTPASVVKVAENQAAIGNASKMERSVAKAWQEALGIESVGLNDNFFDLGAHSLTVAEVHANLQKSLGRVISLVDLFEYPTVRVLAGHLSASQPIGQATQLADRARRRRLARQR